MSEDEAVFDENLKRLAQPNQSPKNLQLANSRSRLVRLTELPMKCIDTGIIRASEPGADNDHSVFAARVAKVREMAFFAIKPFAHGIENVG
jgi:hypothetical protein